MDSTVESVQRLFQSQLLVPSHHFDPFTPLSCVAMCAPGTIGSELIQVAPDDMVHDYLPQEFECTPKDNMAIEYARNSAERKVLVDINGSFVEKCHMECLLNPNAFLIDIVINAYIACMRTQDSMLSREHVINAKKHKIQVLDSLCWTHCRDDLKTTLEAVEHNFKKAQEGGHHINPSWSDVLVSSWDVDEHLTSTLQNDCVSCGLFLLKFIEHFSRNSLTAEITQEDIVKFRLKLMALLILWKTNASEFSPHVEADKDNGSPEDCVEQEDFAATDAAMQRLDCVRAAKRAKRDQQNMKMRYDTLVFLVSLVDVEQLFSGICAYLSLLDSKDHLQSTWVSSNDPYPIKLTCEKLRDIMDLKKPMDVDCFNLGICLMARYEFKALKGSKTVDKHLMDLRFCSLAQFTCGNKFKSPVDVGDWGKSLDYWGGVDYDISSCKWILVPVSSGPYFSLYIFEREKYNKDKTIYVLDPAPSNAKKQQQPKVYGLKIIKMDPCLRNAMNERSIEWNENLFLFWDHKIPEKVTEYDSILSGYMILHFMQTWTGEETEFPESNKVDQLGIWVWLLRSLLRYEYDTNGGNLPDGIRDIVRFL
ncbi:hypothetical protein EJB05_55906, partial [Eragrostis curvula]